MTFIVSEDLPETVEGLRIALGRERKEHAHTLRLLADKYEEYVELRERWRRYRGKANARRKSKRDAKAAKEGQ